MHLLPVTRKRIQCIYDLFLGSFFSPTVFADRAAAEFDAATLHWELPVVRGSCRPCMRNQKSVRQSVKLVRRISGLVSSWCCTGLSIWYHAALVTCWKDSLRSLLVSSENVAFHFLQYDISRNMISYLNSEGKQSIASYSDLVGIRLQIVVCVSVPRYIQVHPRPRQNISCYRYHAIG